MSNLEPLIGLPDWREQYSQYLSPSDSALLPSSFGESINPHEAEAPVTEHLFAPRPPLEHRHSLAQLGTLAEPVPAIDRPESAPPADSGYSTSNSFNPESETAHLSGISVTSNSTPPSLVVTAEPLSNDEMEIRDDDEEEDEDEDDMDTEGGGPPKSDAERRAERRKMKRFRLTHQQTRFLMSEFAKQAHPDAAHRERLSREIPGLSSRQVQVWFQNRRAKIKRLNVDDRERMMKMRAVPDDFDNIQALHSPYGAVQGAATPMQSTLDYMPSYADQGVMRPIMIDTLRRQGTHEQISSTNLSPAFGHAGFASPVPLGSPDGMSPLNVPPGDRYYSSHLTSPLGTGPRSANPFHRQNSDENFNNHPQSRRQSRPLQPLQVRGTISRTKSESLQSPLRSSMSWKGDSLDFSSFNSALTSPVQSGRQNSFHNDQSAINTITNNHFDSFPDSMHTPSSQLVYPMSGTSFKPSNSVEPRPRAASSAGFAIGLGLDLRGEYRTPPNQGPSSSQRTSSFASSFSAGGFQSAPLMAPSEFQLSRTPMDHAQSESFMSQLGATMAPPSDYSTAYSQILSPNRLQMGEQQFHARPDITMKHQQARQSPETATYLHQDEFETSIAGLPRKRGYSMPGTFEVPGQ